jgi:hypothetical protein
MRDIVQRAIYARPELTAELRRRGMFRPEEETELAAAALTLSAAPLGRVQLATLLAEADTQFAARAVLRDTLDRQELRWLDRLLKFQKPSDKRDELARIVERAIEGRKGNARSQR